MVDMKDEAVYLIPENIESDIKQIDFYANEESKALRSIASHFGSIREGYSSDNNISFTALKDSILVKIDPIREKRREYNKVLQRNKDIYEKTRLGAIDLLSKSGDKSE